MSKLKINIAQDAYQSVGVAIKDVEFGTVVVRETGPNAAQYLVVSPMDCSGHKALVTLGGGTLKHVEQSTRVFPVSATLTIGNPAEPGPINFIGIDFASVEARMLAAMSTGATRTGRWSSSAVLRERIAHLEEQDRIKSNTLSVQAKRLSELLRANTELREKNVELDRLNDALAAQPPKVVTIHHHTERVVPMLVAPDSERTWFTTLRERMMSVSNVLFLLALQHRGDRALSKRLNDLAEELK